MSSNSLRSDFALLLLRVSFGVQLALFHGLGKLQSYLGSGSSFADPLGIGWRNSLLGTVLGEFVCGLLIAAGLLTRFAAAGMAFTMAIAAFVVHRGDPWAKREMAMMFMTAALVVLLLGAGRWSLDHLLGPRFRQVFGKRTPAGRRGTT